METVAAGGSSGPATGPPEASMSGPIEPSADGGVRVLAPAWSLLEGGDGALAGVGWPTGLGPLLLFVVVGLPVLRCGSQDPLWRAVGWERWVTQRRLARFVASPRQAWLELLGALAGASAQQPALAVAPGAIVAHEACAGAGRFLVATRRGPYPHTDDGVEVRRVFHKLRSLAIENFNEQFKGIFDVHGSVPTRGLLQTQRFALGAVFVYQLTLLHRFEHGHDLRVGLKAFLKAA
jgi:hypothetical protein